jgi:hypothetical protein
MAGQVTGPGSKVQSCHIGPCNGSILQNGRGPERTRAGRFAWLYRPTLDFGAWSAWIPVAALALAACTPDGPAADTATVSRDSAGIRIVESAAPVWTDATRWRVSEAPALQIGAGTDGDPARQFAYIAGVHRLPSGAIAVLDAWAPGVVFFDSAGALLGRVGREGSGPGEFPARAAPTSFTCGTDTVYVVRQDIAAYVPPGAYVRTMRLEPPGRIRACAGGRLVAERPHGEWRKEAGLFTDSLVLASYDLTGATTATIDTLPSEEQRWVQGVEGFGYMRRTFGYTLAVAASNAWLATGFADAFRIELRDTTGALRRIVRVAGLAENVSAADLDRFRAYVFEPWRGNDDEKIRLEEQLGAAEGRARPAFGALRFDRAGNLWVRRYDQLDAVEFFDFSAVIRSAARPTLDQPRLWFVLDPSGRYLGAVETPADFLVHEIGDNWILGVWRDDLDIPYVRQYRLIKP